MNRGGDDWPQQRPIGADPDEPRKDGAAKTGRPVPRAGQRRRSGSKVYVHWIDTMVEALWGIPATFRESPPVFNANVKYLREQRGLTDDKIIELIDLFAKAVKAKEYNIRGKHAWKYFLNVWPKLAEKSASVYDKDTNVGAGFKDTGWRKPS